MQIFEPEKLYDTGQVTDKSGRPGHETRRLYREGHLPARRSPGGRKLLFLGADLNRAFYAEPTVQSEDAA